MRALGEWVLIEPKKVVGLLNDSVTYENEGKVISVGEGVPHHMNPHHTSTAAFEQTIKTGDLVHFRGKSDLLFEIQGVEFFKVKYQDIVCIL